MTWTTVETWAWRCLMPALLVGGTWASVCILMAAVARFVSWRKRHPGEGWSWSMGSLWCLAYFGLQLVGGLWSDNAEAWRFSLEVKSSLWALPLLAAMPGRPLSRDFWWSVGWSVVAYLIWRLLRAGWWHAIEGDASQWQYARFAGDVHPTYLSLHAAVAWVGCGGQWAQRRWLSWAVTALVAVSLGLMGSKAGIFSAAGVATLALAFPLMWGPSEGKTKPQVVVFLALLTLSGWGASRQRFAEMGTAAAAVQSDAAPVQSSSAGRIAVWRASAEIIARHPLGVGTGDVTDALMSVYQRDGIAYASERRLNPHNQWLQAGVAFGWPGMLLLTLLLGWWFRMGWRRRNQWVMLCVCLVGMHALVESVLEVQRGVVFILWLFVATESAVRDPSKA